MKYQNVSARKARTLLVFTCLVFSGAVISHGQIRLPAIDPTGAGLFLPAPNSTTLLTPGTTRSGLFGHQRNTGSSGSNPLSGLFGHGQGRVNAPATPAFSHPADPGPCGACGVRGCNGLNCRGNRAPSRHIIPSPSSMMSSPGKMGEIIMTPHRIVAPVGSEVVVLAGICGGDGRFVKNEPLEWMLSNDSVGQIIEVGGMEHPGFNRTVPPQSKKFDGQYAWGRTGLKAKLLTRGTPTPEDDIDVLEGQTYISLASASAGTTYLTAVAPQAKAWDRRRATTVIEWVDGQWSLPQPVRASTGSVQSLTTVVSRLADGAGIPNWKIRYTIVGGVPAEIVPTGSQTAEVMTNTSGQGTVQIRQQAGKVQPGTTQIRIDVVRPAIAGENELVVESGLTGVTWSSPALALRIVDSKIARLNEPYGYRIEVANPGDQVARDVVISTEDLGDSVEFISSQPGPAVYGKRYEWRLGDLGPGQQPKYVDVQLRSNKRGVKRACFRVASSSDNLQAESCTETEVAAPCLGVTIDGPTAARVGETVNYQFSIANQCDEQLDNCRIEIQYAPGLSAPGQLGNPIAADLGTLKFGERKTIDLPLTATAPGAQCFTINVIADGGNSASGQRCVEVSSVLAGQLQVDVSAPEIATVGMPVDAYVRIRNTGSISLDEVVVVNRSSSSLRPQQSAPVNDDFRNNELIYYIPSLAPGESRTIQVQYLADELDNAAFTRFSATTPSGVNVEDQANIRIEPAAGTGSVPAQGGGIGIPADPRGSLELVVSPRTAADYRIVAGDNRSQSEIEFTLRNGRSTPDQNVVIEFQIPPGLRFADFAPRNLADLSWNSSQTIFRLGPIREIAPNEELRFAIRVTGTIPGEMTIPFRATSSNTMQSIEARTTIQVTGQ